MSLRRCRRRSAWLPPQRTVRRDVLRAAGETVVLLLCLDMRRPPHAAANAFAEGRAGLDMDVIIVSAAFVGLGVDHIELIAEEGFQTTPLSHVLGDGCCREVARVIVGMVSARHSGCALARRCSQSRRLLDP